ARGSPGNTPRGTGPARPRGTRGSPARPTPRRPRTASPGRPSPPTGRSRSGRAGQPSPGSSRPSPRSSSVLNRHENQPEISTHTPHGATTPQNTHEGNPSTNRIGSPARS